MTAPPRSICFGLGNGVGAMPADRGPLGDKILTALADGILQRGGGIGVLVEADDADLSILDPAVWWKRHRSSSTLDGVLLFGTKDRTASGGTRWNPGAPASPVNDDRPIVTTLVTVDDDWKLTLAGLHRPKAGGAHAAGIMDQRLRELGVDLWGMDGNLRRTAIVQRFPAYAVRSAEVMHIGGRRGKVRLGSLKAKDAVRKTTDDDHPISFVRVSKSRR